MKLSDFLKDKKPGFKFQMSQSPDARVFELLCLGETAAFLRNCAGTEILLDLDNEFYGLIEYTPPKNKIKMYAWMSKTNDAFTYALEYTYIIERFRVV